MKIQPQSGLGDLLFALPLIEWCVQKEIPVEVATNHAYALAQYEATGLVTTGGVDFLHNVAQTREGFKYFRYSRYGAHYFDSYFHLKDGVERNLTEMALAARARLLEHAKTQTLQNRFPFPQYLVYAPPRCAARHKAKRDFSCAPDAGHALLRVERVKLPVCIIGQDEIFSPGFVLPLSAHNFTNNLSFPDLVVLVSRAERVVSQISAITALAGLLGVKTDFLPAAHENAETHAKHVAGVVWPFQECVP